MGAQHSTNSTEGSGSKQQIATRSSMASTQASISRPGSSAGAGAGAVSVYPRIILNSEIYGISRFVYGQIERGNQESGDGDTDGGLMIMWEDGNRWLKMDSDDEDT